MRHHIAYLGFVLALGLIACAAQAQTPTRSGGQPDWPDVNERILQEKYHIAPTKEGLLIALSHTESDVRAFAALKLANGGDHDALPAILAALAAETFPGTRISMALAAAQLGSVDGVSALRDMCGDQTWQGSLRMSAASSMVQILGREDCRGEVLKVLRLENESQALVGALFLLPHFKHLTAPELRELETTLPVLLKRDDVPIRLLVGLALRQIGGGFGVQTLRAAIPLERDENVRKLLTDDLKELEAKQGIPATGNK
jgi:hypothetical protein